MPTKLFISSAAEDANLARAIRAKLDESLPHVEPQYMVAAIRSGADWADAVREALRKADQALFLVTPNYVTKPWFFMEWAAMWVQGKPAHVLLLNVALAELPEVMRQAEIVDINHLDDVARLLGSIANVDPDQDPTLTTLAERLLAFGRSSQASWDEARWDSICRSVETGVAILSPDDLSWVIKSERGTRLVDFLRTSFAHPTLMQQVATSLARTDQAELAVRLAEILDGPSQVRIFRTLVEEGHTDSAIALGSHVEARESKRQIAEFALRNELIELVGRIGEEFDQGRDRRAIAVALLHAGYTTEASGVMREVDTNYDRRRFAIAGIEHQKPELATGQAEEMTVGREIRLVAIALREHGYDEEAVGVASAIEQNYERRKFAQDAIQAERSDLAVRVATSMTVGSELRRVATDLFRASYRAEALTVAQMIKRSGDKREFAEDCLSVGDSGAVVEIARSMELSSEKRLLAELLAEIGRDEEAIAVVDMIDVDDEAVLLFRAAASQGKWHLARRALHIVRDTDRRMHLVNEFREQPGAG